MPPLGVGGLLSLRVVSVFIRYIGSCEVYDGYAVGVITGFSVGSRFRNTPINRFGHYSERI